MLKSINSPIAIAISPYPAAAKSINDEFIEGDVFLLYSWARVRVWGNIIEFAIPNKKEPKTNPTSGLITSIMKSVKRADKSETLKREFSLQVAEPGTNGNMNLKRVQAIQ